MICLDDDQVYQWDTNRRVFLSGKDAEAKEAHFAPLHEHGNAVVVAVQRSEDVTFADIPNSLLVRHGELCAWTSTGKDTISGVRIDVLRRNKPSTYVYTPTEVITFEAFAEEIRRRLDEFQEAHATDYSLLVNKPRINDVELEGNKTFGDLGMVDITENDIEEMFKEV